MAQPYIGEIRMFCGNFAPVGWMFCEGQMLQIADNDTLFMLIGTTYGGDGQNTFALPDLRGRIPIRSNGNNPIGMWAGIESVTLTLNQIPNHMHTPLGTSTAGSVSSPANALFAKSTSNTPYSSDTSIGLTALKAGTISPAGGSQPHNNMMPYLCVNYIISLFGIFPSIN